MENYTPEEQSKIIIVYWQSKKQIDVAVQKLLEIFGPDKAPNKDLILAVEAKFIKTYTFNDCKDDESMIPTKRAKRH